MTSPPPPSQKTLSPAYNPEFGASEENLEKLYKQLSLDCNLIGKTIIPVKPQDILDDCNIVLNDREKLLKQRNFMNLKSSKFKKKIIIHKERDLSSIRTRDNLSVIFGSDKTCICRINQIFNYFKFRNTTVFKLPGMNSLRVFLSNTQGEEDYLRLPVKILSNKLAMEKLHNYLEILYLEFLSGSMSAYLIFRVQQIVEEFHLLRFAPFPDINLDCNCVKSPDLKRRVQFTPQIIDDNTYLGFLAFRDMCKRYDKYIKENIIPESEQDKESFNNYKNNLAIFRGNLSYIEEQIREKEKPLLIKPQMNDSWTSGWFNPTINVDGNTMSGLEGLLSDFSETIRQAANTMSRPIVGVDDSTQMFVAEQVNRMTKSVDHFSRKIQHINVNHTINTGLKDFLIEMITKLKTILPIAAPAILWYLYQTERISKTTAIALLGILAGILFPDIKNFVMSLYEKLCNKFSPQGPSELVEDVFGIIAMYNFGKEWQFNGLTSAFKANSRYTQMKSGANNLLHDILNIAQKAVDFILEKLGKEKYAFYLGKNPMLTSFFFDLEKFLEERSKSPTIDYEAGKRLEKLEETVSELSKIVNDPIDRQKLTFAWQQMKPWIDKKRSGFWYGEGPRIEPLLVCLEGESQIGKSHLMHALMCAVLARVLSKERRERFLENKNCEIYAYNENRKHQDSYVGQAAVLMDDIGCARDFLGNPNNIYMEVLRMINTAGYHMEMADLPNKADAFFKSLMVWWSTNVKVWMLESMTHPQAFLNRIHIAIHVELTEEAKKGLPTEQATMKDNEKIFERWEHCSFTEIKYQPHAIYTKIKDLGNFWDVVKFIEDKYWFHQRKGEKLIRLHDDIIKESISRMPKPQINMGPSGVGMLLMKDLLKYLAATVLQWKAGSWIAFKVNEFLENLVDPLKDYPEYTFKDEDNVDDFFSWMNLLRSNINCTGCPMCCPENISAVSCKTLLTSRSMDRDKFLFTYSSILLVRHKMLNNWSVEELYEHSKGYFEKELNVANFQEEYKRIEEEYHRVNDLLSRWNTTKVHFPCWNNIEFIEQLENALGVDSYAVAAMLLIRRQENYFKYINNDKVSFYTRFKTRFMHKEGRFQDILRRMRHTFPYVAGICCFIGMFATMKAVQKIIPYNKPKDYLKEWVDNSQLKACSNVHLYYNEDDSTMTIIVEDGEYKFHFEYFLEVNHFTLYIQDYIRVEKGVRCFHVPDYCMEKAFVEHKGKKYPVGRCTLDLTGDSCKVTDISGGYKVPGLLVEQSSSGMKGKLKVRQQMSEVKSTVIERGILTKNVAIKPQQYVHDLAEEEIGRKIALKNTLLVYKPDPDGKFTEDWWKNRKNQKQNNNIMMIGGRIGLMNHHCYSSILRSVEEETITRSNPLILVRANDPQQIPHFWFPEDEQFAEYAGFGDGDCISFKLPDDVFDNFPLILKYFVTKSNKALTYDMPGNIWLLSRGPTITKKECRISPTTYGAVDTYGYENGNCWIYNVATVKGDCGSMVTRTDVKSGAEKIIGMHCAGDDEVFGIAFPLFQEDVRSIYDFYDCKYSDNIIDNVELNVKSRDKYHETFKREPNDEPPFKTKIFESPLHNSFPQSNCKPADPRVRIGPTGEKIDPIDIAMSKNIPAAKPLNTEAIKVISEYLLKYFSTRDRLPNYEKKVQSFETCVVGKDCDPYWKGINKSTSGGYGYNKNIPKGYKGKQHYFGKEEYDLTSSYCEDIKQEFEEEKERLRRYERSIYYVLDTAKDECLPSEKVDKGKIRIFSACCLLLLLVGRAYFGDFRAWFLHNRIYNNSAIGINVYSKEWDLLVRFMTFNKHEYFHTPMYMACDFSKFDGSMARVWMYYAYRMMTLWYNDKENYDTRMNLAEHFMNSYHVFGKTSTVRHGSNPSGSPNTADLNTIVNIMYYCYCALLIISKSDGSYLNMDAVEMIAELDTLFKYTHSEFFGDDFMSGIHPESKYYGVLTESAMIDSYQEMGVYATTDSKSDERFTYRSFDQITFLKRTSYYDNKFKRYIGKLAMDSILKSVQWFRPSEPAMGDYKLTLQKALEELSLHDSDEADEYMDIIIKEGREKVHFVPVSTDKHVLKTLCLARDEVY